jgi:uncharacterized protein (UPF0303 family)
MEQQQQFDVGQFYREHVALRNQGVAIDAWAVADTVFKTALQVVKDREARVAQLEAFITDAGLELPAPPAAPTL